MKKSLKIVLFVLLLCGVFGADEDEVKSVSVMEGDSVTLNPDPTKIRGFIKIQWWFGETLLAQTRGAESSYEDEVIIFKDRLQLDQTGSLTIKNMRTKHSGLYKIQISHSAGTSFQKFSVTVNESPSVDAIIFVMKNTSVTEGDPVTLHVPQLQGNELIVWRFGDGGKLIAKHDIEAKSSPLYDTDERFRDRLQLNDQTGSLIITNSRTTDSGLYTVKISSNKQTLYKRFIITVSAVPDSGVSPGAVAGIIVSVLLVSAAAAGVMYLCRPKITNLPSQTWSVPAGDDVTLNPETEIQTGDEIQWLFRDEDTLIAGIRRENREMTTYEGPDGIFENRPKLDKTTGSLTIKFINTEHTGLYTLKIRRGRETLYKRFMISVEETMRSVMKGDPVTLIPDTKMKTDDEIQWLFDDKEKQTVLAEIKTTEVTKHDGTGERFRDRLELNKVTGSLTIRNFTDAQSGFYTLKIRRRTETLYKRFFIYAKERITVREGGDVNLKPATEINKDDLIQWMFRDEEQQTLIAEIKGETGEIFTHYAADGRFRGRLKLDETTGSLTIKNTRTAHSGRYHLQIRSSRGVSEQTIIVTVKDKVEKRLLNEGDPVTLNPDTEIQRDDLFLWMFGDQDNPIAQVKGETEKIFDDDDANKRFKGRLKLDETTGSLIITDIRAEHTGLYKLLTISSSRGILFKKFRVVIHLKYMPVTAGESVHLYTGLTEIQTDDEIQWMFRDEETPIAQIKGGTGKTYDGPDGRFRDRLQLNKTGDLIISNSTAEDAGHYKVKIRSSKGNTSRTYSVYIIGSAVTIEARKKLEMKENNDSTGNRVNESVTEVKPLLNRDDLDVVNEEEGTSSL